MIHIYSYIYTGQDMWPKAQHPVATGFEPTTTESWSTLPQPIVYFDSVAWVQAPAELDIIAAPLNHKSSFMTLRS